MRQMLAAMDVGLLNADLDPAVHPRPHAVALASLDDPGRAVDVQADPLAIKVQEDQANMGFSKMLPSEAMTPLPRYSG
jgi:hypothetical protein